MLPEGFSLQHMLDTSDVQKLLRCSRKTAERLMKKWHEKGHAHKRGGTRWFTTVGDLAQMEPLVAGQLMEMED